MKLYTYITSTISGVYICIHCYIRVGDHESMFSPELVPLHAPGEL